MADSPMTNGKSAMNPGQDAHDVHVWTLAVNILLLNPHLQKPLHPVQLQLH